MRIVVKMGGNVVQDPAQVATVAAELAHLLDAGHSVVVVHGGGPQLDVEIGKLGEAVQKVDGLRVTSPRAALVVEQVLEDIGQDLTVALNAHGVAATHLGVGEQAFQATVKDARLGRVGTATAFVGNFTGRITVVTPVGYDGHGPLNLNADEGAATLAAAWQAHWLILATDVAAVRGASGEDIAVLSPEAARGLIGGAAKGGMIPKLQNAVQALASGVGHVLIARLEPGLLRDAVAGKPVRGTLVRAEVAA